MQIKKIQLQSKKLNAQKAFYVDQLGFDLLHSSSDSFSIQAGTTKLIFEKSNQNFYYHFAFNIPSFQIQDSFEWLQSKKVAFIKHEESYIVNFESWNAEGVYFYDADGNIVELIARKNMAIESQEIFSINSILHLSEIGMPVLDVEAVYQQLTKELELEQYSGDQHYFCTMGREEGLFIIVDQKVKKWMPTELPAIPAPFKMQLVNNEKMYDFEYTGTNCLITSYVP